MQDSFRFILFSSIFFVLASMCVSVTRGRKWQSCECVLCSVLCVHTYFVSIDDDDADDRGALQQ